MPPSERGWRGVPGSPPLLGGGLGPLSVQFRAVLKGVGHFIQHRLHDFGSAFGDHAPTHETACFALDRRDDIGFVCFDWTTVNHSSSSIWSGVCVGLTGVSGTCSAASLNHASTLPCVTPVWPAANRKLLPSSTLLIARYFVSGLAPTAVGCGVTTRPHALHRYF